MPFISAADEIVKKSFTSVENKFISKYLPVLEPIAIKVYLYSLYIFQNGMNSYTFSDLAKTLNMTEEKLAECYSYLEEFELAAITSVSPFEVKILEAENVYGTPKKFKAEKYSDFAKSAQTAISGRMVSTNEYRKYFYFMEEFGLDQNALLMIINYCVNLKGDNISFAYIKKVVENFINEGITSAKKVEEKLSAYTSSTPALVKLFSAAGIKKRPDIDDDKLYKKWTEELGFEESAIIAAAKLFKVKTCEKLDEILVELYKNRRFDVKEIEDYFKNKTSVYNLAYDLARNLGVYMQNPAPYVENYVNVWCNFGYTFECLKSLSVYCFKNGRNSFEFMNEFVTALYNDGIVADSSVNEFIEKQIADEKLLKSLLNASGLTRKINNWDRENLKKWRSWNFSEDMLSEAAKLSSGKSNPMAYMNGILSGWKAEGVFTPSQLLSRSDSVKTVRSDEAERCALIERHYYDLRNSAETRAENALKIATADKIYGELHKELNELTISLAFAEISNKEKAAEISKQIDILEQKSQKRLSELGIDKTDFVPRYSCKICNDTGYDKSGNICACMKKFIADIKI